MGPRDEEESLVRSVALQNVQSILIARLRAEEKLFELNNQLAVLSREYAQKNKELEKTKAELTRALEDLQTSHWHLRKIQEVLPLCLECGKVKSGVEWQDVAVYLKNNALFLSHGYCPDCTATLLTQWNLPTESK